MKKLFSAAVTVSALLCAVSDAKAYCGFPEITTWYDNPAPVSIPVYIVNAGPTSVGLSGLSTSAYAHAVFAAMETFNQTSSKQPRLRFAGYLSADTRIAGNVPVGSIVIDSSSATCDAGWACDGAVGCASPLGTRDAYRVGILAASCDGAQPYAVDDYVFGVDLQNILTHELGHALGLQHTNEDCPDDYLNGGGTSGIMTTFGNNTTGGRRLRRDDISGMRALWGTDSRTPKTRFSTDGGASFSNQLNLPTNGLLTRSPLASSSSMHDTEGLTVLGWTANNNFPTIMTGDWNGSWDDPETVDVNATYVGIAVAVGRTGGGTKKVMAAWYANDSLSSVNGNLRVGVKTYNNGISGGWTYASLPNQSSKAVGLGFDDDNRRFVLATLDPYGHPVIQMLSPSIGTVLASTELAEVVSTIGDPACYVDGGGEAVCVIPFSNASTSGPCQGWYTIRPEADGTFDVPVPEISCTTKHYGPYARLVADVRAAGSVGYLSNHDTFSSGSFFWAQQARSIPRDGAGGVAPPASLVFAESADWTLGVGAMNKAAAPFLKLRIYVADP